ncbi:MAG: 50S ribosomal protein L29 [Patescibacteria group bacterium]
MKIIELRKKTKTELIKFLEEEKEKLGELRLKISSRQLTNVSQVRKIRTNVAQAITLLNNQDYIDNKSITK